MEALSQQQNPGGGGVQRQRSGKGLEKLFKKISRKKEGGNIDPDLQNILNEVKGLSAKGEGVVKVF